MEDERAPRPVRADTRSGYELSSNRVSIYRVEKAKQTRRYGTIGLLAMPVPESGHAHQRPPGLPLLPFALVDFHP
jgi:hypothetical protein